MTEKSLPDKRAFRILVNNEIIGGVISFAVSEKGSSEYAYELFNSKPWASVGGSSEYTVTLQRYGAPDNSFPRDFRLAFAGADSSFELGCCNVKDSYTFTDKKGRVITRTVITASDWEEI